MNSISFHQTNIYEPVQFNRFSQDKEGELLLLNGRGGFGASHLMITELIQKKAYVHLIDCAIRLDIFQITSSLKNECMLDNILIQRAFTPYQILDSVKQISIAETRKDTVYFYLAPFKQFFDGDVKSDEAEFLLKRLIREFVRLKNSGIHMVIAEKEKYASKIFPVAMKALRSIATREINFLSLPKKVSEENLFAEND